MLVPWHRPQQSSSEEKSSSVERDLNSATTDEEDLLHYHAYHTHADGSSIPRLDIIKFSVELDLS